jgi:cytochrome b involved in lipid metabolism
MIKNLVTISLIIFIVALVGVLGTTIFVKQQNPNQTAGQPQDKINNTDEEKIESGKTDKEVLASDVATHNTVSDCWQIINGKVYNVTDYIPLHPAGADKIIPFCGKDASVAFNTKGGKGPHSQKAEEKLNNYYIGLLK